MTSEGPAEGEGRQGSGCQHVQLLSLPDVTPLTPAHVGPTFCCAQCGADVAPPPGGEQALPSSSQSLQADLGAAAPLAASDVTAPPSLSDQAAEEATPMMSRHQQESRDQPLANQTGLQMDDVTSSDGLMGGGSSMPGNACSADHSVGLSSTQHVRRGRAALNVDLAGSREFCWRNRKTTLLLVLAALVGMVLFFLFHYVRALRF
ncbi:uncharacterized protein LOC143276015 [Babylonia areolata]|uniref:uncharacterized protein LOC143276015 n=1 Tax=Babylonia areolata TaxID=304850 RepID=UPI003FD08C45